MLDRPHQLTVSLKDRETQIDCECTPPTNSEYGPGRIQERTLP